MLTASVVCRRLPCVRGVTPCARVVTPFEDNSPATRDENAPIELDEDTQRLAGFVRQEEQRRGKRLGRGDAK